MTIRSGSAASIGRIDQYELLRELGGGGFGCVYLARDTVAGIEVAVKGLPPLVRQNREELENIRRNFALVSRLHHPNIAAALHLQKVQRAVYDKKDDAEKLRVFGGDTLVVMQYDPGVTLSQWRKQFPGGKVPLDQAVGITRQIASALDYAHGERILHRDIKPANVMIETAPDGKITARVLDFGLAAEIRSSMGRMSREITDTSGTRPYMAPEQWLGGKQGRETDQYSLAVLFYELVTGEVPFASVFETGDPVVMMNVVGREPLEIPSDLPRHIQFVLAKALAKKREERFSSCTEFVDALVGRGFASPRRRWSLVAGLAFLAVAIAGGIWVGRGLRPRRGVEAAHPECAPYRNARQTAFAESTLRSKASSAHLPSEALSGGGGDALSVSGRHENCAGMCQNAISAMPFAYMTLTPKRKENIMSIFTLTPTYVFESITFGDEGDSSARLCARNSGFFAWLGKLINRQEGSGLVFEVHEDRVYADNHIIPARKIANVRHGYTNKFWLLLLAVICVCIVIFTWGAGIMFLFPAAVFAYLYSRSRTFVVEVFASSGVAISFGLKRSDFGGAELPDEDIARMMRMVEKIAVG